MIIAIILRLTVPLLIFRYPCKATITSFILDDTDGFLFAKANFTRGAYSNIDKLLDLYWYLFILFFIVKNWSGIPHPWVFIALFILRLVGQVLFFTTGNRHFLLFFPNVFEHLFWIYLVFRNFRWPDLNNPGIMTVSVLGLTLIKVPVEYPLHFRNFSITNFLSRTFLGKDILNFKK